MSTTESGEPAAADRDASGQRPGASGPRNRLSAETSPYLLQHAGNPVDWYPWGEEAFARARAEDKPILLSVGYSSCHWCHVMAHESFENPVTADLMNRWFVNVKVDREERPDVDGVYMTAVQALTGRGGWPMTIFMDADGRPFYAGTYFPPDDRHGLPGFPRVLNALHTYWSEERERLLASAEGITDHIRAAAARPPAGIAEIPVNLPELAVARFREQFDRTWGGFGAAPKFPSPGNLEFLLAYAARQRDERDSPSALSMVVTTLRQMAGGGMYDQLGGGFARYSVDERWIVPHFEKMLYDNAQLVPVYLHAWQLTGEPLFERIVRETLDYLEREMQHESGGFYSAQDADSEGIEGKFFVWSLDEVREVLGKDAGLFAAVFGVTPEGNFQDPHHPEFGSRTVLTRRFDRRDIAQRFNIADDEFDEKLEGMRTRMLAVRDRRIRPGLDDKVLTGWNGLALSAFAIAGRVLGDIHFRERAERNAAFLREQLWRDGRLLHTWKDGRAKIDGMAEDYAYLGLGLVDVYQLSGDFAYLDWARELLEVLLVDFREPAGGGFFETRQGGEQLLVRQKEFFDQATPSANGAAAKLAFLLGRYFDREDWIVIAHETVSQVRDYMLGAPSGFGSMLQAVELLLAPRQELVITGAPDARAPLEREAARHYRPWQVIAPGAGPLPLFEGRDPDLALAYVCENMTCQLPAASPEDLRRQLG